MIGALAVGLATCVLLWPISRQLGARPAAAGLAVIVYGTPTMLLAQHLAVTAIGLGALCLAGAVAVSGVRPARPIARVARSALATVAAVAGLWMLPVGGVAGLVLGAHLLAVGAVATRLGAVTRYLGMAAALTGAGVLAVLVTGDRPLAAVAGDPAAAGDLAALATVTVMLAALTWWRARWLTPIGSAALALLACALAPDTNPGAALALLAPLLAVTGAVLVDHVAATGTAARPALVLALATVAVPAGIPVLLAVSGPEPTTPVPVASPSAAPRPTILLIPALGVRTALVDLAVDSGGELLAPDSPGTAGWFAAGTVPGDVGPAVIGGHVDSRSGPGIFQHLDALGPGDAVYVTRSDGRTVRFEIVSVRRHPKDRFPTDEVYGPAPGPELRLVTCGGRFDPVERRYRDNVVATAVLA